MEQVMLAVVFALCLLQPLVQGACVFQKPKERIVGGADELILVNQSHITRTPQYFELDLKWKKVQESGYIQAHPNCSNPHNIINCSPDWQIFLDNILRKNHTASPTSRLHIFNDGIVTRNGFIGAATTCQVVHNWGCAFEQVPHEVIAAMNKGNTLVHYPSVITIAGKFGDQIWHFVMEALLGLHGTPPDVYDKSMIHVTAKTHFVRQWFDLLGVPDDKIVTGSVRATKLYAPEFKCGLPFISAVQWLRQEVFQRLNIPETRLSSNEMKTTPKTIVLLERHRQRSMKSAGLLNDVVTVFAAQHHYQVVVHSDKKLPPLADQILMFSNASIIVGAHGAGLLFMAFAPENACVIDFTPQNTGTTCYPKLAYSQGINYINAIDGHSKDGSLDIERFKSNLLKCDKVQNHG